MYRRQRRRRRRAAAAAYRGSGEGELDNGTATQPATVAALRQARRVFGAQRSSSA